MSFAFIPQELEGLVLVRPRLLRDARGSFLERYRRSAFVAAGIADAFVQENHSVSARGVLRGIHYQLPPHAQAKLVWVTRGSIWDVCVDLRRDSPSFGRWHGIDLSAADGAMLYVPAGLGHGFQALEDETHVQYKCTHEYRPEAERGIRWDDPLLAIAWPLPGVVLSEKDAALPRLAEAEVFGAASP